MANLSCSLLGGITLGCSTLGGIKRLYLGEWSDVVGFAQNASGVITGLTSGFTVYQFEQDSEHSSLTQTGNFSTENGTAYFQTDLSLKMIGLDANVRNRLVELSRSPIMGVIESNAGEFYIAGIENPGRASSATASLGLAFGDLNGVDLTITFKSPSGIYLMNSALLGTTITVL